MAKQIGGIDCDSPSLVVISLEQRKKGRISRYILKGVINSRRRLRIYVKCMKKERTKHMFKRRLNC